MITIALGADHRGFALKLHLLVAQRLETFKITWLDVGCFDDIERSDYPEYAIAVSKAIQEGQADLGILMCGTGVGMAIAANRFQGIYAGLVWNAAGAEESRSHDKVNVLVLPSDFVTSDQAVELVAVWLNAAFLGGRYQERIDQIDRLGGV